MGFSDGRELWKAWQLTLDQILSYKNSQRFAKMSDKQKNAYLNTMHQKLKAISQAAYEKDQEYINRIKKKYENNCSKIKN